MDKKIKRQILWRPNQAISETLEDRAKIEKIDTTEKKQDKPKKELSPKERSVMVYKWISDHPMIYLNGVCKLAQIDRANFIKAMKKEKKLKAEIIIKLIEQLKKYGYAE